MGSSAHRSLLASISIAFCTVSVVGQDRPLQRTVEGEATPSSPQVYRLTLKAGDLITGTLELVRGRDIAFEVFDPAGTKVKAIHVHSPGRATVGVAASSTGDYRVRVTRVHATLTDSTPAAFVLRTEAAVPPSARMQGVHVRPVVRYLSPRILQLTRELETGRSEALARFWVEARAAGGPLVERFDGQVTVNDGPAINVRPEDYVLVTFLWKEVFDTYTVRVTWPQYRPDDFSMSRVPGTDVWHKTVLLRRGSRLPYALVPNDRPDQQDFTAQRDPLNPRRAWEDETQEYSLLELEGAPDESWFRKTPTVRGRVSAEQQFQSPLLIQPPLDKGQRRFTIYTPPDYSPSSGPYPFLLLFDGDTYEAESHGHSLGFHAPATLDNLISSGRIRPVIVCFLRMGPSRQQDLSVNANPAFANAMAREFLPWLRTLYPISSHPKDVIIGGASAGGSGAASIAFRYPEIFGNVLSQSGGFGSAGRLDTSPTIVAYRDADRRPIRFYLDVGLYENAFEELPINEQALAEGLTNGNRHFRDVLTAKGYEVIYRETGGRHDSIHFRATLADGLMSLLGPVTPQR